MFKVEIKGLCGAAYSETDSRGNISTLYGDEIARQLRKIADYFEGTVFYGNNNGSVNDINGNKTCTWELDIE